MISKKYFIDEITLVEKSLINVNVSKVTKDIINEFLWHFCDEDMDYIGDKIKKEIKRKAND